MKYYKTILATTLALFFIGCGAEETQKLTQPVSAADRGSHFQGRDCLSCHNLDLAPNKHLTIAGTLYKSANVEDMNDLENTCNADLAVEFLDASSNVVHSTVNYYDEESKGNLGQGNVFLLDRLFNAPLNGTYTMRIITRDTNQTLAQSNFASHSFSSAEYSIDSAIDFSNRISCNACHNNGVTSPLFVQSNVNLCQ